MRGKQAIKKPEVKPLGKDTFALFTYKTVIPEPRNRTNAVRHIKMTATIDCSIHYSASNCPLAYMNKESGKENKAPLESFSVNCCPHLVLRPKC
uniref:Uncharacterized protein n=1 Tax=Glossina palpalis gambiensis TaxID=67801 RepID=A0A1B0BBR6_9MUSC